MMDCIKIIANPMRLTAETFLFMSPKRYGKVDCGTEYSIEVPEYGVIGKAKCINQWEQQAHDIKQAVLLLDGDVDFIKRYAAKVGHCKTDIIQLSIFKFTKRHESKFWLMVQKEMAKMGMPFVQQTNLNLA
jgi:hypothetical protein